MEQQCLLNTTGPSRIHRGCGCLYKTRRRTWWPKFLAQEPLSVQSLWRCGPWGRWATLHWVASHLCTKWTCWVGGGGHRGEKKNPDLGKVRRVAWLMCNCLQNNMRMWRTGFSMLPLRIQPGLHPHGGCLSMLELSSFCKASVGSQHPPSSLVVTWGKNKNVTAFSWKWAKALWVPGHMPQSASEVTAHFQGKGHLKTSLGTGICSTRVAQDGKQTETLAKCCLMTERPFRAHRELSLADEAPVQFGHSFSSVPSFLGVWHMPVIPTLGNNPKTGQSQGQVFLSYTVRSHIKAKKWKKKTPTKTSHKRDWQHHQ